MLETVNYLFIIYYRNFFVLLKKKLGKSPEKSNVKLKVRIAFLVAGTPQALTPILTGKTELELPEARSEMGDKAQFVDVYPWIWNEYERKGYLTGKYTKISNLYFRIYYGKW